MYRQLASLNPQRADSNPKWGPAAHLTQLRSRPHLEEPRYFFHDLRLFTLYPSITLYHAIIVLSNQALEILINLPPVPPHS